ncbi:MAG: gspG [Caulobacteraceae bacterium]|nr:gspG [Caulobacteraceae bacterium]
MRPLSGLNAKRGYTLTEMLVVIGIIGLIAAVLTPAVMSQMARARAKTAEVQLDTLAASVELFFSDVGRYPTDQEGLGVLVDAPAAAQGWKGPYVKGHRKLNDPWGQPIAYHLLPGSRRYVLTSLGADGVAGGTGVDADIIAPDDDK